MSIPKDKLVITSDKHCDKMSLLMDIDFPRWLTAQREAKGWSQSEFARAANVSRQVISDYEGYKRKYFDETILRKIAHALKKPPEEVFREAGLLPPAPNEDPWIKEQEYKLRMISPKNRGIAGKLIDTLVQGEESEIRPKPKAKPAKA